MSPCAVARCSTTSPWRTRVNHAGDRMRIVERDRARVDATIVCESCLVRGRRSGSRPPTSSHTSRQRLDNARPGPTLPRKSAERASRGATRRLFTDERRRRSRQDPSGTCCRRPNRRLAPSLGPSVVAHGAVVAAIERYERPVAGAGRRAPVSGSSVDGCFGACGSVKSV